MPLRFSASTVSKKRHIDQLSLDFPVIKRPRCSTIPKHLQKSKTTQTPTFQIFEDTTAIKAANPTTDEIKTDRYYANFDDKLEFEFQTDVLQRMVSHKIQIESYKYGRAAAKWFLPIAKQLDNITPFKGYSFHGHGFQDRLKMWKEDAEYCYRENRPGTWELDRPEEADEPLWFPVEMIEDLAVIAYDMEAAIGEAQCNDLKIEYEPCEKDFQVAMSWLGGYLVGAGVGMDVGNPNVGEPGNRFYQRQYEAWAQIMYLHLGAKTDLYQHGCRTLNEDHWWQRGMRWWVMSKEMVNWRLLEHFWGDRWPPSELMRRFGDRLDMPWYH